MPTGYKFELTPIRFDDGGELIFFGFPLFGGWLPFIGFVTFPNKGEDVKAFTMEWFLRGIVITTSKLELEEYDEDADNDN